MKRNGNTTVNKIYNPRNRQPDIPLDADEVDSAMERFIRKKYQEKSLADGKPQPPRRNESLPPVPSKSPENSPPPPVPSKKGRFFGFGLRASSSAYPLSKHDKKKLPPEPRVESAWTIDSDRMRRGSRMDDARAPMTDAEIQLKLQQLRDMGFSDTDQNTNMLRRLNGNVERTVEALVQLGPRAGQRSSSPKVTPQATGSSRTKPTTAGTSDSTQSAARPSTTSTNPFDMPQSGQSFGISMAPPQQPRATGASFGSNNPYEQQLRNQPDTGLNQAFAGMQLQQPPSLPLFPHSTGGYPPRPQQMADPRIQSMTPPVPSFAQQQYGYTASPSAMGNTTNPFFQQAPQLQPQLQSQATGNNPFFSQTQQPQPMSSTAMNPFLNSFPQQQPASTAGSFNPFGIPPSSQSPPQTSQYQQAIQTPQHNIQVQSQPLVNPSMNPFQQQSQAQQPQVLPQSPNFPYGQAQQQYQQQHQPQPQLPQQNLEQYQMPTNPYSAMPQSPPQAQQPTQMSPLMPQQTGRYDKQSIMALYNYPQMAPSKPQGLSSIPEPVQEGVPSLEASQPKRGATMPVSMSTMHSAGRGGMVVGSRNPFMQGNNAQVPQQQFQQPGIMARHASQESVSINNLENGRHSPDAFANLSARYVR